MGYINHRASLEKAFLFLGRTLCLEHMIRILGLTEYIHQSTIKRIGMVTTLMVERVPETSTHVLPGSAIKSIIASISIGRIGIMPGLDEHGLLSPVACYTTG